MGVNHLHEVHLLSIGLSYNGEDRWDHTATVGDKAWACPLKWGPILTSASVLQDMDFRAQRMSLVSAACEGEGKGGSVGRETLTVMQVWLLPPERVRWADPRPERSAGSMGQPGSGPCAQNPPGDRGLLG